MEGLKILLDDDDFVVVDKPVGVAAHPSPGWVGPTVVGGLAGAGYRISTSGAPERVGIVHRLDVGTSGVMVVAKTERAYTALKRAFKERTVDKVYHAVVQGLPDPLEGTIDAPIGRHPGHDWRFAVIEDGRAVGDALRGPGGLRQGNPGGSAPGDRPDPPDPRPLLGPAPPVRRRPDLRGGSAARRHARADPAVAARPAARFRPPASPASGSTVPASTRRTWPTPWRSWGRAGLAPGQLAAADGRAGARMAGDFQQRLVRPSPHPHRVLDAGRRRPAR